MNRARAHYFTSWVAGLLFGTGLIISGMTQPQKVLNFLDPLGRFDPSLIFVMVGAIAVHVFAYRYRGTRAAPLFAERYFVPTRRDIDARLLVGALLFGVGWGLGGYCPGPALVSLSGGGLGVWVFTAAMIAGMFATAKLEAFFTRYRPGAQPPAAQGGASSRTQPVGS